MLAPDDAEGAVPAEAQAATEARSRIEDANGRGGVP
jgi:hypothetical protein